MAAAAKSIDKEKLLLSFLDSSGLYSQMPQGFYSDSPSTQVCPRNFRPNQNPDHSEEAKAHRGKTKEKGIGEGDLGTAEEGKKRRLKDEQVNFLEMKFGEERKLDSSRKVHLATEIGLDPKQVAVWFQNRRARWKSKQLEDEYLRLRSSHDAVLLEKCRLENEILKLRDKLVKSEEEIKRLTPFGGVRGRDSAGMGGAGEVAGVESPNSSLTSATHLGEFAIEEIDGMYATTSYADYMMELGYLYGM